MIGRDHTAKAGERTISAEKSGNRAVNGTINRRTETGDFQCESVF